MLQLSRRLVALLVVAAMLLASCAGQDDDVVSVMAASSLFDVFTELEAGFEAAAPAWDLQVSYGASSTLRDQILEGARADLFASANAEAMSVVFDAGDVTASDVFATNELTLAVPAGNPGAVYQLSDLGRDDVRVGLCAEGVPCGNGALSAIYQGNLLDAFSYSIEPDARALRAKLELAEFDVAIVYVTDVQGSSELEDIGFPDDVEVVSDYVIAPLTKAMNEQGAAAFVEFLLSEQGQAVLVSYGFGSP